MSQPGAVAATAQAPLLLSPHHSPPPASCYGVPADCYQAPAPPHYIVVPLRPSRRRCGALLSSLLALLAAALLLGAAGTLLWPAAPDVRVARLHLRSLRVYTNRHGGVALDVDVGLEARVRNPNLYALRHHRVSVEVGYRGRRLGAVDVGGAWLRAREESRVGVRVRAEGVWVLEDTAPLVEDVARGMVPLGTVTRVKGRFHVFGWGIPMQGRISCAINVDVENQIIASQDCYPEQAKE